MYIYNEFYIVVFVYIYVPIIQPDNTREKPNTEKPHPSSLGLDHG